MVLIRRKKINRKKNVSFNIYVLLHLFKKMLIILERMNMVNWELRIRNQLANILILKGFYVYRNLKYLDCATPKGSNVICDYYVTNI